MLEFIYKYILIEDVLEWDGMVLDDGFFFVCELKV